MELQRNHNKRPPSDDAIVALYWARDEKAIKETDAKYGIYLLAIALRILRDEQDGEECINDTRNGSGDNAKKRKYID